MCPLCKRGHGTHLPRCTKRAAPGTGEGQQEPAIMTEEYRARPVLPAAPFGRSITTPSPASNAVCQVPSQGRARVSPARGKRDLQLAEAWPVNPAGRWQSPGHGRAILHAQRVCTSTPARSWPRLQRDLRAPQACCLSGQAGCSAQLGRHRPSQMPQEAEDKALLCAKGRSSQRRADCNRRSPPLLLGPVGLCEDGLPVLHDRTRLWTCDW